MYGENTFAPIELVEAAHYGDRVVVAKFSDLSIACMTVAQYDAIMDHAFELCKDAR